MSHTDKLMELEDRIFDLEFAAFEEWWNTQGTATTRKTTPKTTPAKRGAWSLHMSTQPDGTKQYRMQSAAGAWTTLPANRSQWPKDLREMEERFEEFDKQRRIGGKNVAMLGGTCTMI
jgi:hypothetical protein